MDISEIMSSLTEEDMKRLRETADSIFGISEKQEAAAAKNKDNTQDKMMSAFAKLSLEMNRNDESCVFLQSLKPLLSPERSSKVDDAIRMIKIIRLIGNIKESAYE